MNQPVASANGHSLGGMTTLVSRASPRPLATPPQEVPTGLAAVSLPDDDVTYITSTPVIDRPGLTYADIPYQPTLYLAKRPAIAFGTVTVIYGDGAIGKGRMLMSIAAAVTRGWPVGADEKPQPAGDVIVISGEDNPHEQMRPRLEAAAADMGRVYEMRRLEDGTEFQLSATPRWPHSVPALRKRIDELVDKGGNPKLVIIDPITKVTRGSMRTTENARYMLKPLMDLAEETGVAIVLVAHTNKDGSLQGAAGLLQEPRVVYRVWQMPEPNSNVRVITPEKANDLPPDYGDVRYTIISRDNGSPRVVWLDKVFPEQERAAQQASWRARLEPQSA